jgi:hypothetical protein
VDVAANAAETMEAERPDAERIATEPSPTPVPAQSATAPEGELRAVRDAGHPPVTSDGRANEEQQVRRKAEPRAPAQRRAAARPGTQVAKESAEPGEAELDGAGPSLDQVRRFQTKKNKARTPAEIYEALRYGVSVGAVRKEALAALAGAAPEAAAQPQRADVVPPPAPTPTPAAPTAPPSGQATEGATPPTASAQVPPPPPPEPTIQGVPVRAVKAAADNVRFAAAQLKGVGVLTGWGAVPVEPMVLFEGQPFEFRCEGNPERRFVELGSLELGAFMNKTGAGDGGASPFARRVELGLLGLALVGPAVFHLGRGAAGKVADRVLTVKRALGAQLRRWRR